MSDTAVSVGLCVVLAVVEDICGSTTIDGEVLRGG
jgi:hypothetical protein